MDEPRPVTGTIITTDLPRVGEAHSLTVQHSRPELRHPLLAFIERRTGDDVSDAAGVTQPAAGGPSSAGPTSGQWGSG
jgi:hypothetical protein